MFDKLKALRDAKHKMSDPEKSAKMSVMKDLHDMAGNAMSDKLKGLKKVSVMSDTPEGVKAGLKKAEDMVEGSDAEEASESPEEAAMEKDHPEMEAMEEDPKEKLYEMAADLSSEDLDACIKKLTEMKMQKKHGASDMYSL